MDTREVSAAFGKDRRSNEAAGVASPTVDGPKAGEMGGRCRRFGGIHKVEQEDSLWVPRGWWEGKCSRVGSRGKEARCGVKKKERGEKG